MRWQRGARRLSVSIVATTAFLYAALAVFDEVQVSRAQIMLDEVKRGAVRRELSSEALGTYLTNENCCKGECTRVYAVDNWPLPHTYTLERLRPVISLLRPRQSDWGVETVITAREGMLIERRVSVFVLTGNTLEHFGLIQSGEPESLADRCVTQSHVRHAGYGLWRDERHRGLHVELREEAEQPNVERAFDLRLNCVRKPGACARGDAIAPKAAEDYARLVAWIKSEPEELQRADQECEAFWLRALRREEQPKQHIPAHPGVPVPQGLKCQL
jgi:hypothetical protein